MKEYDEIKKSLEKIECDLMSRERALGKKDHRELLIIEENQFKKNIKHTYECLYCGEKSEEDAFKYKHKCEKPQVVDEKERSLPSRPIRNRFFKIVYNGRIYRFENYLSAMKFRNIVWIQKKSIQEAMKDTTIKWWTEAKKNDE